MDFDRAGLAIGPLFYFGPFVPPVHFFGDKPLIRISSPDLRGRYMLFLSIFTGGIPYNVNQVIKCNHVVGGNIAINE
jgi:hypothetical protein